MTPPQTGTWEIQVTAEGNTRVRVQGEEEGLPGKGRGGHCRAESKISHIHLGKVSDYLHLLQLRRHWTSSSTLGSQWRMAPTPGLYPLT